MKKDIKEECTRLIFHKSLDESIEVIDIFIACYYLLIKNHHNDSTANEAEKDAKQILQMMFSKLLHLKKLLEGVDYVVNGKTYLQEIVDPTVIASLVRNIYETTCTFNLIYRATTNSDEKKIIYNLWVIEGLSYRQKFEGSISTKESLEIIKSEKEEIEFLKTEIETTPKYKNLEDKFKKIIQTRISKKDFRIYFKDNSIICLDWKEIPEIMGCNPDFFNDMYSYFSLYAHPSNVSVFQFEELFKKETLDYQKMTVFNMRYCFTLCSIFLADYLMTFPSNMATYEKMGLIEQGVTNFYNKSIRGISYSINQAYKTIGI